MRSFKIEGISLVMNDAKNEEYGLLKSYSKIDRFSDECSG